MGLQPVLSMDFAQFKPILTALIMPPTSPLLLLVLAILLWNRRILALYLSLIAVISLWVMSSHGFAVLLARMALPQVAYLEPTLVVSTFKNKNIQAIVVLGGGIESRSLEYGSAQPNPATATRLQYGMWLSKTTNLPMAFSGGVGWSAPNGADTEAKAADRWLVQSGWPALKWSDDASRDTAENAQRITAMLRKDGVERIALVTHAWHMPRALKAFESTGLQVTPAPTAYTEPIYSDVLQWLPSGEGLNQTRRILREMLALALLDRG
jgi:uncharacterized SAM-binding protein YcdF (DUF218 family)